MTENKAVQKFGTGGTGGTGVFTDRRKIISRLENQWQILTLVTGKNFKTSKPKKCHPKAF
jgi:hypothetical protein